VWASSSGSKRQSFTEVVKLAFESILEMTIRNFDLSNYAEEWSESSFFV